MEEAEGLVARLRHCLPAILAQEPVSIAYLHGSASRGQATPQSDVDVALVVARELRPAARLALMLRVQVALADRCGIAAADVRVIDDAPLVFRGRVITEGFLVYERDEAARVDFEVRTRLLYFDYLPTHRALQDRFFRRIRERGLYG